MTKEDDILDLNARFPGRTVTEVARDVGCSTSYVFTLRKKHGLSFGRQLGKKDNVSGVSCPKCDNGRSRVRDSRLASIGGAPTTRRRRKCSGCGHKFTTYEIREDFESNAREAAIALLTKKIMDALS